MQIVADYEIEPAKETPGCYRYARVSGDAGVVTLYVRKEALKGAPAPERLTMILTPKT